jgi:hypothetical protein
MTSLLAQAHRAIPGDPDRAAIKAATIKQVLEIPTEKITWNEAEYHKFVLVDKTKVTILQDPLTPPLQVFADEPVELGVLLKLLCASSGYELLIHSSVNQQKKIPINSRINELGFIASYISYRTSTSVLVYPESKMVVVLP